MFTFYNKYAIFREKELNNCMLQQEIRFDSVFFF